MDVDVVELDLVEASAPVGPADRFRFNVLVGVPVLMTVTSSTLCKGEPPLPPAPLPMVSLVMSTTCGRAGTSTMSGPSAMDDCCSISSWSLLRARLAPLRSTQSMKASSRSCLTAMKASLLAAST